MENWQDATSRQVRALTGRLNELLSGGLELLRSELGVDLGLKPDLIPPWVVMLAACIGLVLMVALWASTCRAMCRKRPAIESVDHDCVEIKAPVRHVARAEEVKRKKKKTEKKSQAAQPNGRVVAEPQEEAIVAEESVPHHQAPPPELKAEPVSEVKKSKKKAKQTTKETANGKEPEGGTWETKVSNKEKREQRKKDKTPSDGSASPRAGDTPNSAPPEQLKTTAASVPSSQKKKKGDSSKIKAEKVEDVVSQVNSSESAMPAAVVAGVLTDNPVKVSSHTAGQDNSHSISQEKNTLWGTEIDGSWTVIESGIKTSDLKAVSLTGHEVVAEPQASEQPWSNQPQVEDEWSGLNGASVDPSSDWNAPSEAWGNFEEPIPEPPVIFEEPSPEPTKDEEEKMETAADGATKTKKKKKKKKRAAEDGDVAAQEVEEAEKEVVTEAPVRKQQPIEEAAPVVQIAKAAAVEARVERPVKENASQKPPVTPVPQKEPTAKQNDIAAPTQQKKLEESQAPKPAKKKKARRET